MKNITDKLFWVVVVAMGVYILYSKGVIGTNFESVSAKVAYEMIQNDDNLTILDVRTLEEFKVDGHLEDAKLLPLSHVAKNLNMVDKSKRVLVYCRSGNRSVTASRILEKNGYVVVNMRGGLSSWKAEKLPVER